MVRGPFFDGFSHVLRKRASAFRLSFSGVSCKSSTLRRAHVRTRITTQKMYVRVSKIEVRGDPGAPEAS